MVCSCRLFPVAVLYLIFKTSFSQHEEQPKTTVVGNSTTFNPDTTLTPTTIAHSDYCPQENTRTGNKTLTWRKSIVGATMYSNQFCANEKGKSAERYCNSGPSGPVWDAVQGECSDNYETSKKTDELHKLLIDYILLGVANYSQIKPISEEVDELTYVDQYLLARAFYAMTLEDFLPRLLTNFGSVLNNIMELNVTSDNESTKSFEPFNYTLAGINVFFKRIADEHHNLTSIFSTNFHFEISNPFVDNITGFAMYTQFGDSFVNYTVKKLYANETHEDLLVDNLEVAGYVSKDLLNYLQEHMSREEKENLKILVGAFHRNKLFKLDKKMEVVSRIIAVSVSGFCGTENLPLFDIFLKPLARRDDPGEWFLIKNSDLYNGDIVAECSYAPVTYLFLYDDHDNSTSCKNVFKYPFAEVNIHNSLLNNVELHGDQFQAFDVLSTFSMSLNNAQPQRVIVAQYEKHDFLLRAIMLLGCALSMLGVLGLILTVLLIKNWHQRRWYSLQLVTSMAFETLMFLLSGNISYIAYIILYYFMLSQFSWMMLIGYIQYLKFVKIFDKDTLSSVHSLIIGWLVPLIVVAIPICIYPKCLYCTSCSEDRTIISFFVIVPTSLVILGNIIIYVMIMLSISRSKSKEFGKDISKKQTRIGILLPFMLGITWIFVFALVSPWSVFALIGSYLLHLIAPIQAFVLFVFIVILDAETRFKWKSILFAYKKNKVTPSKANGDTKTAVILKEK